jgi:hypothetical protein
MWGENLDLTAGIADSMMITTMFALLIKNHNTVLVCHTSTATYTIAQSLLLLMIDIDVGIGTAVKW